MDGQKKKRGRPKGSGVDDSEDLAAVADLLAANPRLKPTTAMKRVRCELSESHKRRLQVKWKIQRDRLLAEAITRKNLRSDAPAAVSVPARRRRASSIHRGSHLSSYRHGNPAGEAIRQLRQSSAMEAMRQVQQGTLMEAMRQLQQSPAMEAIRQLQQSPGMEAIRQLQQSPAMEAIRQLQQSPAMEAIRQLQQSPVAAVLQELRARGVIRSETAERSDQ